MDWCEGQTPTWEPVHAAAFALPYGHEFSKVKEAENLMSYLFTRCCWIYSYSVQYVIFFLFMSIIQHPHSYSTVSEDAGINPEPEFLNF